MASGGKKGEGRKADPGWEHGDRIPGTVGGIICKYCHKQWKSGGVTRLKYHLTGLDPQHNVVACDSVPPEIKEQLRQQMRGKASEKDSKGRRMEEIREELRGGIYQPQEISDSDDESDDVVPYPRDIDPSEKRAYKKAIKASKADEWEREQFRRFETGRGAGSAGAGGSGRSSGPTSIGKRSHSTREAEIRPPAVGSYYKTEKAKQKTLKNLFSGGRIKEGMGRLVSKFFIYDNVPPAKASSHHFKNMIAGAQASGTGIEPPTPYEIRTKYLDLEVEETDAYITSLKPKWVTYGCTIMCDGWTGPTKRSIINFMVYSKGQSIFLRSIDASDKFKDHKYIYGLMKSVVQEIGSENIVQVVTDNGSNYKKAGEKLMSRFNLYWTPCAAHCIDLIFESIAKRDIIKKVILRGRTITNFLYNHNWLLAQMREKCGGDIVRPGPTRFATNYIALESLLKKRGGLRNLFTSDEWLSHPLQSTSLGKKVETAVLNSHFWERVASVCTIYEPLYRLLRLVDSEVYPTLGVVFEAFRLMKEALQLNNRSNSDWIIKIIDDRWDKSIDHPLLSAAYYLNPKYQYKQNIGEYPDLIDAVLQVFQKLDPNSQHIGDIGNEIIMFREAKRSFGDRTAIASRDTMAPADWWSMYGTGAPTLRRLAMKILAQTASSSACERNWSTFALIHTKQRNRLASESLEKMVYCYYNMKLRVRDLEAEEEKALEMEPLNLLDIDLEIGDEEEFPLFEWIRPSHLDEADGAPNPKIAEAAQSLGIDVDKVIEEEVRSGSGDSFQDAMRIDRVNSDSSGGESDGGGSGGGSGGGARTESARPLSPFTGEAEFTHATQDTDHGSRSAGPGVGAIGKQYARKKRGQGSTSQQDVESLSINFGSMSIDTEQSSYGSFPYGTDSSFDSQRHSFHVPYGQSSLFDFDSSAYNPQQEVPPQISYVAQPIPVPMETPGGNLVGGGQFPPMGILHRATPAQYLYHLTDYANRFSNNYTWREYCLTLTSLRTSDSYDPPRNSMWY